MPIFFSFYFAIHLHRYQDAKIMAKFSEIMSKINIIKKIIILAFFWTVMYQTLKCKAIYMGKFNEVTRNLSFECFSAC